MPTFISIDQTDLPPFRLPPPSPTTTVLAVAMGDAQSTPALCAVRYTPHLVRPGDPLCGELPLFEYRYLILDSRLLPAGSTYPQVAARINATAQRLYNADSRGDYHVVIDATQAGYPVIAAIRDSIVPQCHVSAVTISKGDAADASLLWRNHATVGLAWLISRLQALLTHRRLDAPGTPEIERLLARIRDYQIETDSGPDLVRALALACVGEHASVRYDVSPDLLPSPPL